MGREYAVFEPGCRHVGLDIEGQNSANPTALLLTSIHMLRHLNHNEHADLIYKALFKVLKEGKVLTRDLQGSSSTTDFTKAVISAL